LEKGEGQPSSTNKVPSTMENVKGTSQVVNPEDQTPLCTWMTKSKLKKKKKKKG
jgi:hypothetical protein